MASSDRSFRFPGGGPLAQSNAKSSFEAPTTQASALAAVCKALGDPLRLDVMRVLSQDTFGVLELAPLDMDAGVECTVTGILVEVEYRPALVGTFDGRQLTFTVTVRVVVSGALLVFENVTVRPSPLWLQYRLTAIGLNPINNIVDLTNYIWDSLKKAMTNGGANLRPADAKSAA